jgi:hypothetical protein
MGRKTSRERRRTARTNFQICPTRPDLCVCPVGRVSQPVSAASPTKNRRRPGRKPASGKCRRTTRTNFQICPTWPWTSVSAPLGVLGQTPLPGATSGVAGRANLRMSRRWASIHKTAWRGSRTRLAGARTSVSARWVFIGRTTLLGATSGVARRAIVCRLLVWIQIHTTDLAWNLFHVRNICVA